MAVKLLNLVDMLEKHAKKEIDRTQDPCAIIGDDEFLFEHYCHDCATTLKKESDEKNVKIEIYGSVESDNTVYCARCETPLEYTLTINGIEDELYHYLHYGWLDSKTNTLSESNARDLSILFENDYSLIPSHILEDYKIFAFKVEQFLKLTKFN